MKDRTPRRILVAIDFSPASRRALPSRRHRLAKRPPFARQRADGRFAGEADARWFYSEVGFECSSVLSDSVIRNDACCAGSDREFSFQPARPTSMEAKGFHCRNGLTTRRFPSALPGGA